MADVAHTFGSVISYGGLGIAAYQGYQAYSSHYVNEMVQSGADIGVGVYGLAGGPVGWAMSTGYFGGQAIDHFTGGAVSSGMANAISSSIGTDQALWSAANIIGLSIARRSQ